MPKASTAITARQTETARPVAVAGSMWRCSSMRSRGCCRTSALTVGEPSSTCRCDRVEPRPASSRQRRSRRRRRRRRRPRRRPRARSTSTPARSVVKPLAPPAPRGGRRIARADRWQACAMSQSLKAPGEPGEHPPAGAIDPSPHLFHVRCSESTDRAGDRAGERARGHGHPSLRAFSAVAVSGYVVVAALMIGLGFLITDVPESGPIGRGDADATSWLADHRTAGLDGLTKRALALGGHDRRHLDRPRGGGRLRHRSTVAGHRRTRRGSGAGAAGVPHRQLRRRPSAARRPAARLRALDVELPVGPHRGHHGDLPAGGRRGDGEHRPA